MDTYDDLMQQIAAGIPDAEKDAFKRRIFRAMNGGAIDEGQAQCLIKAFNLGLSPRQFDRLVGIDQPDPVVDFDPGDHYEGEDVPPDLSAEQITLLDYASYGAGRGEICELMGLSRRGYYALMGTAMAEIGTHVGLTRRPLALCWQRTAQRWGIEHDPSVPKRLSLFRSADVTPLWDVPFFSAEHEAVMSRYSQGMSQAQIGRELDKSRDQIAHILTTVCVILGVNSRQEAVTAYLKMQQGAA